MLGRMGTKLASQTTKPVKIALCATFTTEPIDPYIGVELLRHGIAAALRHSPYN